MIIYKILGGVLIVASSITVCVQGHRYEARRLSQIKAYIDLLGYVKNQIECYLQPIDRIVAWADPALLRRCGIDVDAQRNANCVGGALLAPDMIYGGSCLCESLERFLREFGASYSEEQVRSCERYIAELSEEYKKLKEKQRGEARLRLTILVSASLSLVLMLI